MRIGSRTPNKPTRALAAAPLTDDQLAAIDALRASCLTPRPHGVLSPIQQAEREDAIADWLDDHGVDSTVAEPLAETTVTLDALDRVAVAITGPTLDCRSALGGGRMFSSRIASEIQEAATRISGLVTAVKGFTHMDQATVAEPVDLKSSVGNTVAVLASKARAKSVAVTVTVPADLPQVHGFIGELNQIWANLIDNALDAVAESGRVDVSGRSRTTPCRRPRRRQWPRPSRRYSWPPVRAFLHHEARRERDGPGA